MTVYLPFIEYCKDVCSEVNADIIFKVTFEF